MEFAQNVAIGITAEESQLMALHNATAGAVDKAVGIKILGDTPVKSEPDLGC